MFKRLLFCWVVIAAGLSGRSAPAEPRVSLRPCLRNVWLHEVINPSPDYPLQGVKVIAENDGGWLCLQSSEYFRNEEYPPLCFRDSVVLGTIAPAGRDTALFDLFFDDIYLQGVSANIKLTVESCDYKWACDCGDPADGLYLARASLQ